MVFLRVQSPSPLEGMLGRKYPAINIRNTYVGPGFPTYFIAEIGINHNGSLSAAKELIDISAEAGVDAVKFQKRTLERIYQQHVLDNPNMSEEGYQYFIPILREVEFDREQYDDLFHYTRARDLEFLCTPFDEEAADFLDPYDLPVYKVASADMSNLILLEKLVGKKRPLLISTGMSTLREIDYVGQYLKQWGVTCVLMHCVSAYPTPVEDSHLNFLRTLSDRYGVPVGFSSHEVGMEITLAAVAAGACIVERHITLDKRQEGPDHSSSLEPDELKEVIRRIRLIDRAMGSERKTLSRGVIRTRETLAKSLVASIDIQPGTPITRSMISAKGPGKGLSPLYLNELIGNSARRLISKDDFFVKEDCYEDDVADHRPSFQSTWGFKGRFTDLDEYVHYNPRFVEIHLNDQDVEYPFEELHTGKRYPYDIFLHYPTYWFRSVVNLASENEEERRLHISVIQKVIDLARRIAPNFTGTPRVVVHLGGMDIHPMEDNHRLIELAYDSIRRLSWDGIIFLPENNPPRPWYFSGQWYDNAFCAADEMINVCNQFDLQMCLDLSHAKLYSNVTGEDYWDYLRKVAPYTTHLHVADGYGLDGEGVQIGEGEIDFSRAFKVLAEYGDVRNMTWTPEIWQGHLYQYRGFLTAFERLAQIPELLPIIASTK